MVIVTVFKQGAEAERILHSQQPILQEHREYDMDGDCEDIVFGNTDTCKRMGYLSGY